MNNYRDEPLKFWFPKTKKPAIFDEGKTRAYFWKGHQFSDLPLYNHRLFPNIFWVTPILRWPRAKMKRRRCKLVEHTMVLKYEPFFVDFSIPKEGSVPCPTSA